MTNKLIKSIDDFLIKKQLKIYLKPGEKPRRGAAVQRGKRGGLYYIWTPPPPKPQRVNVTSYYKAYTGGPSVRIDKEINKIARKFGGKELGAGTNLDSGQRDVQYSFPSKAHAGQYNKEVKDYLESINL